MSLCKTEIGSWEDMLVASYRNSKKTDFWLSTNIRCKYFMFHASLHQNANEVKPQTLRATAFSSWIVRKFFFCVQFFLLSNTCKIKKSIQHCWMCQNQIKERKKCCENSIGDEENWQHGNRTDWLAQGTTGYRMGKKAHFVSIFLVAVDNGSIIPFLCIPRSTI